MRLLRTHRVLSRLAGILTRRILPAAPLEGPTYDLCKAYVDRFSGENNVDFRTNGELTLLRGALGSQETLTVFDVGANIGEWSRLALTVNANIDLHCFEPSRATFDRLQRAGL